MANSVVITVKTPRDTALLKKAAAQPRSEAGALATFFRALAGGVYNASVDVQTSSSSPVRASGTVALTYASVANNDTVTIGGTVLTCVTGTPSGFTQFKKVTDGPTTATNMAAAINGNTTLNKYCSASASSSTVTITVHASGTIGNLVTLATSNGTGFVVSGALFTGGAGGAEEAKTTYSFGL